MLQRHISYLTGVAFLLTLFLQTPTAYPQKPDPKKADLEREIEDYSFFFGKPEKIGDFYAAMKYEISVGRPGVAAMFLKNMLAFAAKLDDKKRAEEWLMLERKDGMSAILSLKTINHWYGDDYKIEQGKKIVDEAAKKRNEEARKDVDEFIKQVSTAVHDYLEDPVRIARYVKNLSGSPEEREYALAQLYPAGAVAIPELIRQLQKAGKDNNSETRRAIRDALPKLSADTVPPLLAALDSNDPLLTIDVIEVLKQRFDQRAVARLWYVLGKPEQNPRVREAARAALAYLTETKADHLPQPREMLTRLADLYYQHRIEFANPQDVVVWRWDSEKGRIVKGWEKVTITATKAEEYWGHRFATQALEIDPAYLPAQIVDLSLIVDKAMERVKNVDKGRSGPDALLADDPSTAEDHKVMMTLNPDLLVRTLERALNEKRYRVVLAMVRALGDLAEVRASRSGISGDSPLVRALNYGDRRVEMAAAEAILRTPGKPPPGVATRVIDVLRRALANDKQEAGPVSRVLVAYANVGLSQDIAASVRRIGYEPVVVHSGRDALRRLNQASDIDSLLVDAWLPDIGLANFMAQVRSDVHASKLPVVVSVAADQDDNLKKFSKQFNEASAKLDDLKENLAKFGDLKQYELPTFKDKELKAQMQHARDEVAKQQLRIRELTGQYLDESQRAEDKLRRFVERYPNTWVVGSELPLNPERLKEVLKEKAEQADNQPLPDPVRKDYAERAMQWLGRIARGELPGYDIRSSDEIAKLIHDSLVSVTLSEDAVSTAVEITGRLPGAESQRQLLAFLHHSPQKVKLRRLAGDELIKHIQRNGILLGKNDVGMIFEMIKDPALDKNLKPVVASLVGLMQPDARVTGERLKDFKPNIAPAPAPPAPPPADK